MKKGFFKCAGVMIRNHNCSIRSDANYSKVLIMSMYNSCIKAIDRYNSLSHDQMDNAEYQIKKIISLKDQLESIAAQKGYSNACTSSIPICKGDCCKYHFPKNLNYLDFFIAIFYMNTDEVEKFANLILNNKKNQCPILLETGCYLSFEQRPVACTNAYPCFADRSYWLEKEKKNILFKKAIDELETIMT